VNKIKLHIVQIKVDYNFNFENYLHHFDNVTKSKILAYKQRKDQVVAFTSAWLKQYYLAHYLNLQPQATTIEYTKYHRPTLYIKDNKSDYKDQLVDFNIAHSGEYVVMAIIQGAIVGIDIEKIDYAINPNELSPIVFSDSEQLLVVNDNHKFFTLWTKKEALIKAHGFGFLDDYYKNTRLSLANFQETENGISLYSYQPADDYLAALCVLDRY
jgi:4'-phosphopantetheinyl transferase